MCHVPITLGPYSLDVEKPSKHRRNRLRELDSHEILHNACFSGERHNALTVCAAILGQTRGQCCNELINDF